MSGGTSADQAFINMLKEIIYENLEDENFNVDELVKTTRMPRSFIHQRLIAITTKSTAQFIREVRLQKAMEMLQEEGATASEVAYKTGFGSPAYFNTCFHEYYGYPPGKVLKWSHEGGTNQDLLSNDHGSVNITEEINLVQERIKKRYWRILIVVIICLLVLSWHLYLIRTASYIGHPNTFTISSLKGVEKSIVILPFKNLSESRETQYFAEGLIENIISRLTLDRNLRVISQTSAEQSNTKGHTAPEIGKKLGANFIIEGSILKIKDRVIVTIQLIHAKNDQHIWSRKFESEVSDIIEIQKNMADTLANELRVVLTSK